MVVALIFIGMFIILIWTLALTIAWLEEKS